MDIPAKFLKEADDTKLPPHVAKSRHSKRFELSSRRDFKRVLKKELECPSEKDEKAAKKAALERKERIEKIGELYALIAQLKQRLNSGGYDRAVAARLSDAKQQLFWLLMAF